MVDVVTISTLETFRDLRGVLGGVDTVNINLVSTLMSKGVHRHPYCRGLRVKMQGTLRTFSDLGSLEVHNDIWTIMGQP